MFDFLSGGEEQRDWRVLQRLARYKSGSDRSLARHGAYNPCAPDGRLDYQPHPKCRTARSIVGHLLSHVDAINDLLAAGGASHHRLELPFKDVADATEQMRRSGAVTATRLAGVAENTWNTMNNRLPVGEHVHFEAPLGFRA